MKKLLLIVSGFVVLVGAILLGMMFYTKSHSPTESVYYKDIIDISYSRPLKNNRDIFGGLVPFDKVWRTGANEATIFATTRDLLINNSETLPAGTYTLFTRPKKEEWDIIFNSETGQWGINMDGVANRKPENDVLTTSVPSMKSSQEIPQFTILIEDVDDLLELVLMWDQTVVSVPMEIR